MTDDAWQDEVERLRAENAALSSARAAHARRGGVVLLLVLGCGLAVLSVVAIWLRVTLLDTDRYVDTVAPIAAQPAVQDAVADKLESAIYARIDFASLAREVLPDRADVLAPGDPDRRAVVHPHADRRVHALAALPGPVGRGQPARAHARSSSCSRAGARSGSCSTTTRSTSTSRRPSTASRPRCRSAG